MFTKKKKTIVALALSAGLLGLITVFAAGTFTPDMQPIGYVGQPAASKFIVSAGNEKLYAGDYKASDWSGNLHSYNLSSAGAISATDNWGVGGAAAKINAQHFNTGRNIVTFGDSTGVPFNWTSSGISATQKTALDAITAADTTKTTSPILDYIRGDFSKQQNQTAGTYRNRTSKLGDIIHSTPVHWSDGATTPTKTVFVGANDGMLHAINADDGTERFAYIPSVLISELHKLKDPAYSHKYYVDGRLDVSNFNGGTQTILAGALGAGGKGLFALDVTNAAVTDEADAASKILWEITNTGIKSKDTNVHNIASTAYANLGYTYGAPTLLTLPDTDGTKALVVGNGYNNTGNGRASLFLINAATGALIKEIDTGSGTTTNPNGLSTPTFWDTNNDGKNDVAYAGDIDGNLWKFSLVGPSYTVTKLHAADTTLSEAAARAQAITTAPNVTPHPLGGYMVNFVTGRMLTAADKTNTETHYAYGIWDGAGSKTGILSQTLTEQTYTSGTTTTRVRTASSTAPDWTTQKGWKVALPIGGERMVGDGALIKDSVFVFLSTNPTISPNGTPPGELWWMQLNALTGGANTIVKFDLNDDGSYNTSDEVTVADVSLKPVGKHKVGGGVSSQFTQLSALGKDVFINNLDNNSGVTLPPDTTTSTPVNTVGSGVSGGHFDEDIYYGSTSFPTSTAGAGESIEHTHEYDDKYDVTGVNMLNASDTKFNLINAIPSKTTQFKVLAQNQYLSPAVSIHIKGNPSYVYNINQGYIPIKDFVTSAELDVTDVTQVPTYNQNSIDSLAINMPVDAFAQKDWWGGAMGLPADVRVGLHPTKTGCVKKSAGSTDGNMYQPVNPPATVTATGNGTLGYSAATTAATATGVRHNGALVIQIIKHDTPKSAIEMSVPGQPQYGWRVKSADVNAYVLAEYTTFWHHDNGYCYGQPLWTKLAPQDLSGGTSLQPKAAGSADPKIGAFGGVPVTTSPGTVTYPPTTTTVNNSNGTTTTTTVTVTVKTNSDGSTTTTTKTDTSTTYTNGSGGGVNSGVTTPTPETGDPLPIGRINWRELQQ